MTVLMSMTDTEFSQYLAVAIPDFARGKIKSGQWAAAEALELSRKVYTELLPLGLATPEHFLFTVRDDGAPRLSAWCDLLRKAAVGNGWRLCTMCL